ncbi:hypothetical protein V8C86DRAFT_497148 [Haematococcus lacustris]
MHLNSTPCKQQSTRNVMLLLLLLLLCFVTVACAFSASCGRETCDTPGHVSGPMWASCQTQQSRLWPLLASCGHPHTALHTVPTGPQPALLPEPHTPWRVMDLALHLPAQADARNTPGSPCSRP